MLIFCLVGCDSPKNVRKQRHEKIEQKHIVNQPDSLVPKIAESIKNNEIVSLDKLDDTTRTLNSQDVDSLVTEDFYDFIERFHSDTLFQRQRIANVVIGFNSDAMLEDLETGVGVGPEIDTIRDYVWGKDELLHILQGINTDRDDPAFIKEISELSDSLGREYIYIDHSGYSRDLVFSKQHGKWILTKYHSSSL